MRDKGGIDDTVGERVKGRNVLLIQKGKKNKKVEQKEIEFKGLSLKALAKLLAHFCETADVESFGCKVTLGNCPKENMGLFFFSLQRTNCCFSPSAPPRPPTALILLSLR